MAAFKWAAVAALSFLCGCTSVSKKQVDGCEQRFSGYFARQTFSSADYFFSAKTPPSAVSGDKLNLIEAMALAFSGAVEAPRYGPAGAPDKVVKKVGMIVDPVTAGCRLEKRDFRLSRIVARSRSRGSVLDVTIQPDR